MKVRELSVELGITNKVLIDFLKGKGYDVHSHMQSMDEEWEEAARKEYEGKVVKEETPEPTPVVQEVKTETVVSKKEFKPDDMIACRSVCPWRLIAVGQDKTTRYEWEYFGDVEYVSYKDLQYFRRKDIIKNPKILIEDADLVSQWRREIGEIYKPFTGVDYPEELLELPNDQFEKLLKDGTNTVREIIKITAMSMIRNQNYPDYNKIILIDSICGTCIKDFMA